MKPRWVSKHAALAVHAEQIAEHGGASGLRDEALLDSALAKPKNLAAYKSPTVFDLAAAYAFGIVRNHPFVDGNKRTGLVVSGMFLYLNGWDLNAPEAETATTFLLLADGKFPKKKLADWFENHCTPLR